LNNHNPILGLLGSNMLCVVLDVGDQVVIRIVRDDNLEGPIRHNMVSIVVHDEWQESSAVGEM
jgi:hypothetical protein